MELYAEIILPLARPPFTFSLDEAQAVEARRGTCAIVRLGARKVYTGIIFRIHNRRPANLNIRSIERLLPGVPAVTDKQLAFWEWIAEYYMCTLGEVMRAALPSALKPAGHSDEELAKNAYKPKPLKAVALGRAADTPEKLSTALDALSRAPKQKAALLAFCACFDDAPTVESLLPVGQLHCSPEIVRRLAEKELFKIVETDPDGIEAAGRDAPYSEAARLPQLTAAQQRALDEIKKGFAERKTVLLHGVTGSGKTEIYIHLIDERLRAGKTVLYLLPEIALTSHLTARLEAVFGDRLTVCHSRLTRRRRAQAYDNLARAQGGRLILGVRSAVFMPLDRLGLVIADEEHDPSYKQSEGTPRYNARDCASWLARSRSADCVMGSATPSLESYSNALAGKYALVVLKERYGKAALPRIEVSDTLKAVKRGERRKHFNKLLLERIDATLSAGRQTILFQNRRGWSPYIECPACGWTAHCPDCSVTLTYHKSEGQLRCHYCGHAEKYPSACPQCGSGQLVPRGFGTEKASEELAAIFPQARIARLDRDTAVNPKAYGEIIEGFAAGRYDVLVGTQMVTKGFDFPQVTLVGILNADNLLNYPDFRASERAFQSIVQVSGRGGRADAPGEVVVQTSLSLHPIIRAAVAGDYEGMAAQQLAERRKFGYPPYVRLISVALRHGNKELLSRAAATLADRLKDVFGRRVYGPHPPTVDRIGKQWILCVLLKIETGKSFASAKRILSEAIDTLASDKDFRRITVLCDVDPQ